MRRSILLDSGVIGFRCSSPTLAIVASCLAWFARRGQSGAHVAMPSLTPYETRRGLLRIKATAKLVRIEKLEINLGPTPVTPEAWLKAAEFWAIVRSAGKPTADPHALDGDAIRAGVVATIGAPGDSVTIATANVGHPARFTGIDARRWEMIL